MAIASFAPDVEVSPKPTLPHAASSNYMGLTYDNSVVPVASLLSYVEGMPWTVQAYYRQVLGEHNDLKEVDPNLSAVYQSYSRIDQMEIRVQSELSGSTDGTTQFTDTTGSALVYGFIIPNVHDYFIAETAHRRSALFRVLSVDRLTWRRESVHGIQYTLVNYVDFIPETIENLKLKTTSEYVFSRDRLMEGLSPILKTSDYAIISNLQSARKQLGDYYLNTFTINSTRTLNLPGQPGQRIYDSFLVDFVLATMGYLEFPNLIRVKQIPTNGDFYLQEPQFWSAILKRDRNEIEFGNKIMYTASTMAFHKTTYVKSLYSARLDYIVYPFKPDESMNSGEDLCPAPISKPALKATTNALDRILTDEEKSFDLNGRPIVAYHTVDNYGHYVLSKAFYDNNGEQMSLLELMTRDYLDNRTLDLKQISFLIHLYPKMERMAQFYFAPLLMCLIRYADQRAYS